MAPVDLDTNSGNAKPPPPPPPAPAGGQDGTSKPPPPPPPPAATTNTEQTPPPSDPNVERVAADVGVETKKGHGYGTGPVATPVAAYFSVRERLALLQVTDAMRLYKATNGHAPKTNEEFMAKIIKANQISLPQLRSDEHRYVYDPKTEQLMVEKPR